MRKAMRLIDTILDYKDEYLSLNKTIIGDDYKLDVYPYDELREGESQVELSECIEKNKKTS